MINHRDRVIIADNIGGTACCGSIFQCIARSTLRRIGTDCNRVLHHARRHQTHCGLDTGRSCFTGELVVCRGHYRRCADCLTHGYGSRLHRVRMRLGTNIDCLDLFGINISAGKSAAACFDRKRCGVFIVVGNGFLANAKTARNFCGICAPDTCDLLDLNSVTGDVCPIGYDSYHSVFLRRVIISCTSSDVHKTVMRSFSASSFTSGCTCSTSIP